MKVANERIKKEAKATTEQVSKAIKTTLRDTVEEKTPVHKEEVNQKIYVGPNIPGLPKYTVVESIEVPHVQNIIKECAALEKLFIAIDQMAEIEARLAKKGTLEYRNLQKVAEYINNKRKSDQ